MTTRRALLGTSALLATGAGGARAQNAAPYVPPTPRPKSLTLLVGAAGGSSTDLWVRGFAPFLERHLKLVQVQVVNRVGEGGLAVMRDLADAPGDGSVLAYAMTPILLARAVERNATALLDRILLLGAVTEEPVALVAPPGMELEALRSRPDGRPLGLPPPTSASAIAAADLATSLPMEQLHFPSAAAARQAAMAGNVAAALVTVPEALVAVREEKLSLLAMAAPARHPQFPEVPTLREEGLPVEGALRRGIAAPARIAPEAAARVVRALRTAAADPEFLAQAESRGILPQFLDGQAWGKLVSQELVELRSRWETSPWQVSGG
ncbi:Bug family tripartite tricarboxylate transporter substrate binding protein [Roseomonas populi]|uniref:Tripartite tricarboxylate transporter substrate-binding protein n=1 Tax=Roseomonas populi TaxID=3121582 RepID=A0ABT1X8B4_9PROT|nr:tripartite tricarboxylate transporter substrate-binding protein [Roseomonas pecuniae]MCR0984356.1 tripartite tricarboxylate transporter substrate-binding protein [Roseomonas pecuniae]